VATLAVAADAASKAWAVSRLSGGRDITVAGGLVRLQLRINHGATFGLAAGYEPLLAVIAFAAVLLLGTWAVRASGTAERIGAALARSPGALHGGVVDWLHIWFYGPTFNLADVWLRGGILIAACGWLWHRRAPAA